MRKKREYDPNDNKKPLPSRIHSLRVENGYSQEKLGELLGGVTKSNIGNYESGINIPPADKIIALTQVFNVTSDYLLGLSDAKTNDITEQQVCDYVGLDIDTVRSLHNSLTNKKLHMVIDFLFQESNLLNKIVKYAWSVIPRMLGNTDYKLLFYNDMDSLEDQEQNAFSGVIFQLQSFHDKFLEYCLNIQDSLETIIFDYVVRNMDTEAIIDFLTFYDSDSDVLHELFGPYDNIAIKKERFEDALLTENGRFLYELITEPDNIVRRRPGSLGEEKFKEEKELFIATASTVLREKAKRKLLVFNQQGIGDCDTQSFDTKTSDEALKE